MDDFLAGLGFLEARRAFQVEFAGVEHAVRAEFAGHDRLGFVLQLEPGRCELI